MALKIRRRGGQGITIDGVAVVRIVEVKGRSVSLLITAPLSMAICRTELIGGHRAIDPSLKKRKFDKHAEGRLRITRREGRSVLIGGDVLLTIERIRGGRVEVAINAPRERRITRTEISNSGNLEKAGEHIDKAQETGEKSKVV